MLQNQPDKTDYIMDMKDYIKQASLYNNIIAKWRLYLLDLEKKALSSKKSTIRIIELNDQRDLIQCKGLEDAEEFKEIKEIHKLIVKEKELYDEVSKLIKEPEDSGLFTFKKKSKEIRNQKLSRFFKKLLSINTEQTTRLDLFIKSLELINIKNGGETLIINRNNILKKENTNLQTLKTNNTIHIKNNTDTTRIASSSSAATTTIIKKSTIKKPNNLEIKETTSENQEIFDYETEMKRILGL